MRILLFGLVLIFVLFYIGQQISVLPLKIVITLLVGFIFSVLTLHDLKIGLFLLMFAVPFTQQVSVAGTGQGGILGAAEMGSDDVLILFIIFAWLYKFKKQRDVRPLNTTLNWPLIAFFAVALFSCIGGNERFGAGSIQIGILHLFKFYEYVLIYFIVISVIKNLGEVSKYLRLFFVITAIVALLQIIAIFTIGTSSLSRPEKVASDSFLYYNTMSTFQSNAILGAYYVFFLSILLAIVLDMPNNKGKTSLVFFAIVLAFCLFNTFSRSAYLGLLLSFLILGIFKEKRFIVLLLFLIIITPVYMQSAIKERITLTVKSFDPILVLDESATIRIFLWKRALGAFLSSPLLGKGYWMTRTALGGVEAHSQFLAILVETGVVGFSIFCWLIIRMYKNALFLAKNGTSYLLRNLGIGYIAGLSAILVTCIFSETLEAFRLLAPLWFVTALVSSANNLLQEKSSTLDIDST